jgi:hypothetical protein
MSKTDLRSFKLADPRIGRLDRAPVCASLAQFGLPRTLKFAKINAELSEINMEINNLHRSDPEPPKSPR